MLTFPNITPEVFARVLDELRKHSSVTEEGPGLFVIKGQGISASAALSDDGMIDVNIASKPWYISEGMIGGKIRDAITAAQREVEGKA